MKQLLFKYYLSLLVISIFCFGMTLNAQPYYYYQWYRNDTTNLGDIFRINFLTGAKELFFSAPQVGTSKLEWDNTQTWLYYWNGNDPYEGRVTIINTNNPSLVKELPECEVKYTTGVKYSPQLHRVYISSESNTYVYDDISLSKIDSFDIHTYSIWENTFSSEDGTILYCRQTDPVARKSSLTGFSLLSKKIISRKLIDQIGPPAQVKIIHDRRKGKALFGYDLSGGDSVDTQYLLYDAMKDTFYTPIHFPIISEAFLSGDAQYVIINENPPFIDPNLRNPSNTLGGKISIFQATTGKLVGKLSLPPDGQIMIFDNYPNMMYYYLPYKKRSINIDLSQLGSDTCTVKLLSSIGSLLTTGTLQYRDSIWENATNNNDGTFTINTTKKKLSLRMTYAYGTQTKSNVTIKNDTTIIFQTKNVAVNLQNSQGNQLDTGIVQYNAGGWQDFGTTLNGVVTKELLPIKYTFRLTYNGPTVSKTQNIDSNATVVFQTVPANVQLQTSTGTPLDTGVVQFDAGGWKNFGTTLNGVVTKELLPTKYTFRIAYNGATISKAQSIDSSLTVVFHTIPAIVQLQTSTGALLDTGIVEYNSGGWRSFGTTSNGITTKELLPTKYTFRVTYDGATVSKAQSIDSNATVIFQTVKALVQFNNSKGNPIDTGIVQFNSGGWKDFGSTLNGVISKELLPVKYTFKLTYNGSSVSIAQNVDSSATINFSTVLCTVSVTNSSGSPLNNATVSYNAGGWKVIGITINGIVTIELLPVKIQFRAVYGTKQQSVTQDVSINPLVAITLPVQ